jgi:hypothetical protein
LLRRGFMSLLKSVLMMFAGLSIGAIAEACATQRGETRLPEARVAQTRTAIEEAERAGAATRTPQGALHLRTAEEESDTARRYAAQRDDRRAETMLIRANVDADLAKALAEESEAKAKAQKAHADLEALQRGPTGSSNDEPNERE